MSVGGSAGGCASMLRFATLAFVAIAATSCAAVSDLCADREASRPSGDCFYLRKSFDLPVIPARPVMPEFDVPMPPDLMEK